jgi:hypothetical protein
MPHPQFDETRRRGRLAYDPLDPARLLWCQHLRGEVSRPPAPSDARPYGLAMFALEDGELVRLRYVENGEYYIMRGEHPHVSDELLHEAACAVCGARIDLRCTVEIARQGC